jgi:hypothetical protein
MSWYTDWFLADEAEAEAVAGIATGEDYSFDDWPHLSMKSVGEMELMSLWALLGRPEGIETISRDPLYHESDEDGGVIVDRVAPGFITALAALHKPDVERRARDWHACEAMAQWELKLVAEVLWEMAEFARRAGREGKPVLQLSTW